MTNEAKLRHIIVSIAIQYLGWAEINGQDDLIIDKYNDIRPKGGYKMNHKDSWCAAFLSVVKHEAGFDSLIPTECSCQRMIEKFKAMGRYEEDGKVTPQEGDVIFYNWDDNTQPNDGWADHVGLVVSVTDGIIKVIEGNASDRVKYRDIPIGWGYIRGYGLPDYASISKEVDEPKEEPEYTGNSIVEYLKSIDKDSSKAARERLAIEHGIKDYKGSAAQNLTLLKLLRDGVAPVQPAPAPQPMPSTPPTERYQIGKVYEVAVNQLRVRTGPGTSTAIKVRKDLTPDGQKHADQQGRLCSGTAVQCLEIRKEGSNIWMRIPSGWIAARFNGTEYVR